MTPEIAGALAAAAGAASGPVLARTVRAEAPAARAAPLSISLVTAGAFAGIAGAASARPDAWAHTDTPVAVVAVVLAHLWLAAAGLALALIDAATHRLPNRLVLPGYVVVTALLVVAALAGAGAAPLLRALGAGALLFLFHLLLRAGGSGGMGGGDVKLAGVLGLLLGWAGWDAALIGLLVTFVGAGLYGVALLLLGRAGRRTALSFGPWMIAGAWAGILAGATLPGRLLGV